MPQAALLVGLVKAPTDLDPFNHPQAARDRRDLVIDNMADQKYITAAQDKAHKASPLHRAPPRCLPRGCAFANPRS